MKKMRRFAAIAAAAAMTACMAVPMMSMMTASAVNVTIKETETGHSYSAYQIFKGSLSEGALTSIQWGTGVNYANADGEDNDLLDELNALTIMVGEGASAVDAFEGLETATDVANAISKLSAGAEKTYGDLDKVADVFAKYVSNIKTSPTEGTYNIPISADGYYLIIDGKAEESEGYKSASKYLLNIVDADKTTAVEVTVKKDAPTVMKKIKENSTISSTPTFDGVNYTSDIGYNDTADYCIGDAVPFKLYGSLPDTLDNYQGGYKYVFHDSLDTQFDAPKNIVVKVGNYYVKQVEAATDKTGYFHDKDGDNCSFDIAFADIKSVILYTDAECTTEAEDVTVNADDHVTVEYTAVLNNTATPGRPGQQNEVYLTYSSNSNNSSETTDTTRDNVIAFTYELDLTKVDSTDESKKLTGASFVLTRTVNNVVQYAMVDTNTSKIIDWVTATGNVTVNTTTGKLELAEGAVWTSVYGLKSEVTPTVITTDSTGSFKYVGLDDGTYTVLEIKAPTGYKIPTTGKEFEFTLTADTTNGQAGVGVNDAGDALVSLKLTDDKTTIEKPLDAAEKTATNAYGIVDTTITNTSSSTLPSTGGIGTTLFYVIGGTMAAGAGVALIAKKRMKNEE